MYEQLHEREQYEQLKEWWKQYGGSVLLGVVLALALSFVIHYWRQNRLQQQEMAATVYQQMLVFADQHDAKQTDAEAQILLNQYPKTPYAAFAAMVLASQAVERDDLSQCERHLRWVLDHSPHRTLKQIARMRMARVLIAQQKPSQALDILKTIDDASFQAEVDLIRGQAFVANKDDKQARLSLQHAVLNLPSETLIYPIAQMQLDDLAADPDGKTTYTRSDRKKS